MNSDFESPPKRWAILATVGGVVTAIAAIVGLESLSGSFHNMVSDKSMAERQTERSLAQKVKEQAAACKFDQTMAPNRGITFETRTFYSQAMQQTRRYGLVFPPHYAQNPQQLYPVMMLLHGGHGNADGWQSCAAITEVLHTLYKSGKLPPAIVVIPDGNDRRGSSAKWDPAYFDGPNGNVATLIASDLAQEVKSHYRVLDDPDFWAIGGLSSGGWGAFNIGLRHLDQFHLLFSIGGYFTDKSGAANSPAAFVPQIPAAKLQSVKAYLDAGTADAEFLTATEQFHLTLKQLGVDHEFHMFTGGHGTIGQESGWYYWHDHLVDALSYIGTQWNGYNAAIGLTSADVASLDAQSSSKAMDPGKAVKQLPTKPQSINSMTTLTPQEEAVARQAWQYFQRNWNQKTGLVNSADGFASVTLWDQAAAIAALVSAKELKFISDAEFSAKMDQMLNTLAALPLYRNELPNKVYNTQTLMPVNYGKLDRREEIGWSALDLGRMALWLKIVQSRYPQFHSSIETLWQRWKISRLTQQGQLYGTSVIKGKEQHYQEGRLGYESYAAYGLSVWGLKVEKALDTQSHVGFVNLYGQAVPYDQRDYANSEANNYVLSEPYILDGIETGFQSLPKAYADQVLAAQEARYFETGRLTAVTEDNLDRAPYFAYNTLFVNGQSWSTITSDRDRHNDLRFLSAKAAIGWHVLYNSPYTQKLYGFVEAHLKADGGWYNGFYETLKQPNQSLTANNNGVILESMLYKQVGQPLTVWAGVKAEP